MSIGLYKIVIFIYKNLNTIKVNLQVVVKKHTCKSQKEFYELKLNFKRWVNLPFDMEDQTTFKMVI